MKTKLLLLITAVVLTVSLIGCGSAPAWVTIPNSDINQQLVRFRDEGWTANIFNNNTAIEASLLPDNFDELGNARVTIEVAYVGYFADVAEAQSHKPDISDHFNDLLSGTNHSLVISQHFNMVSVYFTVTGNRQGLLDFLTNQWPIGARGV